jgi:hypothetical protein
MGMADFSVCTSRSCRTETPGIVDKCPACGARVQTSRKIRLLGWLSIGCGVFLIGLMGWITLAMYPSLTNPGVADQGGGRWTGTAEEARMALNLFYLVIGFGVVAVAAGAWMVVTGRRHILITVATLIIAAILALQTWETTRALKQAEEAREPRRYVQPPTLTPPDLGNEGAPAPDKPQ